MTKLTHTLNQKMNLKLSPEQILIARLIEIPSVELTQRINEELQNNPTLEELPFNYKTDDSPYDNPQESNPISDNLQQDDQQSSILTEQNNEPDTNTNDDDDDIYVPFTSPDNDNKHATDFGMTASTSIIEHLKSQIYLTKMDKPQRHIAKWVIGNIDDDGFLRRNTQQLCNDLYFQEGLQVDTTTMDNIINQIRTFDPPGIASDSLQSCLIQQLKQKKQNPNVKLAIDILKKHFNEFSHHQYNNILENLNITTEQLKNASNEITKLNPKPINAFSENVLEKNNNTIIPDFFIENKNGDLFLTLNTSDIPRLNINQNYERMLSQLETSNKKLQKDKSTAKYLKGKIGEAKWFIKAIQTRNETLFNTMSAIMLMQKEFFLEGETSLLKPMILQDVAQKTGYDISTISRVSNSKYVQTNFGIFPLKFFFSDSFKKNNGEVISSKELKNSLLEIIKTENKKTPLNDDQLAEKMNEKGFKIARRTITKYRKLFNIPTAKLRRQV